MSTESPPPADARRKKRREAEIVADLLERQLRFFERSEPLRPGQEAFIFQWSAGIRAQKRSCDRMIKLVSIRNQSDVLSPCPIYRALTRPQRRNLLLRAPKGLRNYVYRGWRLLELVLDAYIDQKDPGVSPVTAMALLVPEHWYRAGHGRVTPELVAPRPISFRDKSGRRIQRPTERWQVIVWAIKRYLDVPWRDILALSPDLLPSSTAARHRIKQNVEEPLAEFYRALTGTELDPASYSSALSDSPSSPAEQRDRMRSLKAAAKRGRRWIPEF